MAQWQLKFDGRGLWNVTGTSIGVQLIAPRSMSGSGTYEVKFQSMPDLPVLTNSVNGKNINLIVRTPPRDFSLSIKTLRVDGGRVPPEQFRGVSVKISILSPFYHWQYYGKKPPNPQLFSSQEYFPEPLIQQFEQFLADTTKKVLWISGGPGYGKTFFSQCYIEKELTQRGTKISRLNFPMKRWKILAQIAELLNCGISEAEFKYDTTQQNISALSHLAKDSGHVLIDHIDKGEHTFPETVWELIHLLLCPPTGINFPVTKLIVIDMLTFKDRLNPLLTEDKSAWSWLETQKGQVQELPMPLWTREHMGKLITHHTGSQLSNKQLQNLYRATGGHPYLTAVVLDSPNPSKCSQLYIEAPNSPQETQLVVPGDVQPQGRYLLKHYIKRGFLTKQELEGFLKVLQNFHGQSGRITVSGVNPAQLVAKGLLIPVIGRREEYQSVYAFGEE